MKITECIDCGGTDFIINEGTSYKATVNKKTGDLVAYKSKDNEIETIYCANNTCGREISESEFNNIEFNS